MIDFFNHDDSAIDTTLFTYDAQAAEFLTWTTNVSKDGTYDLKMQVYYSGYVNYSKRTFQIVVEDSCKNA